MALPFMYAPPAVRRTLTVMATRSMQQRVLVVAVALLQLYLSACGGGGGSGSPSPLAPTITSVTLSCSPSTVQTNQTSQCSATVYGTGNFDSSVSWSVNDVPTGNSTVGTISSSGLYSAPNRVPSPQTVTVKAVSRADSTKSATSSVTIWRTIPTGSWQRTGPPGGSIVVLAEDPSSPGTIFAGANDGYAGGLWKSTDAGVTWTALVTNSSADYVPLFDMAVVDGGRVIYAAPYASFFLKSSDGGATWTEVPYPAGTGGIRGMAVDPQNSSTIYVSAMNYGILKSEDGGASWTLLASSPATNEVLHNALQVDPRQTGTVYYGTDHGLYISRDGGTTWSLSMNGIASTHTHVVDLAVSPVDPSKVFALAGVPSSTVADLYQSTDRGNSWVPLACCHDGERVIPDPFDASTIYLYPLCRRLLKSMDGGRTFEPSDNGLPVGTGCSGGFIILGGPTGTMLPLTSAPGTLLVTVGGSGVYRSQDSAQSWSFSSDGISGFYGVDVAVDPQSPTTVWLAATNGGGLSKSTDSGVTWSRLRTSSSHAVSVDPFDSNHVVAHAEGTGVVESHDGGSTWHDITPMFPAPPSGTTAHITAISFNPTRNGTIYVSTHGGGVGVLRSTDGGDTWAITNSGITISSSTGPYVRTPVVVNPQDPDMLFIGTDDGLFKSTNGGDSWVVTGPSGMDSISIDSKPNPIAIYAAGYNALYKSVDLGETWSPVTVTLNMIGSLAVAVDPSSPNSIFLISYQGSQAAGWSPDGGVTWKPLTAGLGQPLLTFNGRGIAIAQSQPQVLFVVSSTNTILRFVIGP